MFLACSVKSSNSTAASKNVADESQEGAISPLLTGETASFMGKALLTPLCQSAKSQHIHSLELTASLPLKIGRTQKETHLPFITFQVRTVSFREGRLGVPCWGYDPISMIVCLFSSWKTSYAYNLCERIQCCKQNQKFPKTWSVINCLITSSVFVALKKKCSKSSNGMLISNFCFEVAQRESLVQDISVSQSLLRNVGRRISPCRGLSMKPNKCGSYLNINEWSIGSLGPCGLGFFGEYA